MAASDPTSSVPTPTGTLQGAAAFSWDGAAWQPAGRSMSFVATPTGTLQGVAPFTWSGQSNGYIRRFRYWPRVLSNTELQQVTT